MKKALLAVSLVLLLVGCSTSESWNDNPDLEGVRHEVETCRGVYEDDLVRIEVEGVGSDPLMGYFVQNLTLTIYNKTDSMMNLDLNQSTWVTGNQKSWRLVDGETRKINSNLAQATYGIAPGTSITRDLYPEDEGGIFTNMVSIIIVCTIDGDTEVFTVPITTEKQVFEIQGAGEYVGTVSVNRTCWQPLFIGNPQKKIEARLLEEAKAEYGPDAKLGKITYSHHWSGLSLLLYFNALGYVVDAEATAEVYI